MQNKNWLVRVGDFFFKWRNYAFPVILVALFVSFPPPAEYGGMYWIEDVKDIVAAFMIAAGLGFRSATIGWAYIKRGGLNKQVYADKLVTSGFFGMCRNPLYVGNMLIYAGIFVMHGHPFVLITGIALYTFIYISIIAAEEFYLKNKFGAEYDAYCAKVPRWIPDFSRYKESVNDMSFSLVRSIAKDYSTIMNACIAIIAIELIEHYVFYPRHVFVDVVQICAIPMTLLTVAALTIKYLKKTGRLKV